MYNQGVCVLNLLFISVRGPSEEQSKLLLLYIYYLDIIVICILISHLNWMGHLKLNSLKF